MQESIRHDQGLLGFEGAKYPALQKVTSHRLPTEKRSCGEVKNIAITVQTDPEPISPALNS